MMKLYIGQHTTLAGWPGTVTAIEGERVTLKLDATGYEIRIRVQPAPERVRAPKVRQSRGK